MTHLRELPEVEIAAIPPLSMGERALLDMHSVVNIVNVVHSDLMMLGLLLANDEGLLHSGAAACEMLVELLGDPGRVPEAVAGIEALAAAVLANVRKYTAPGGHVTAAVHGDVDCVGIVVADDGRGIPEAELSQVAAFGVRASNAADVRTMGGGFGLTKAFLATQRFGGRMWIAAKPGAGTRIRIWLPRPAAAH